MNIKNKNQERICDRVLVCVGSICVHIFDYAHMWKCTCPIQHMQSVWESVCAQLCMCKGQKLVLGVVLRCSPPYFLRQDLSLNPLLLTGSLAGQDSPQDSLYLLSYCWGYGIMIDQILVWRLEISLEHLPNLSFVQSRVYIHAQCSVGLGVCVLP